MATSLTGQTVTVPSGVTLVTTGDAAAVDVSLMVEAGGTMEVLEEFPDSPPVRF